MTPTSLPPIEPARGVPIDSVAVVSALPGNGRGLTSILGLGGDSGGSDDGNVREALTRIIVSAKPRYPEALRRAAVDGRVLVRFVVDTSGRVDMMSVQLVASTHALFTAAVRDVLPTFRFKPSEVGGRRVASLVEMPFEFSIAK
jgi:protein TonB